MAKQVAQRKKRMKDEQLMKQKAVEERKKKLEVRVLFSDFTFARFIHTMPVVLSIWFSFKKC